MDNDFSNSFDFLHAPYRNPTYITTIPEYSPSSEEVAKQIRINADIIMQEISDHVDAELKRFYDGISGSLKPPNPEMD